MEIPPSEEGTLFPSGPETALHAQVGAGTGDIQRKILQHSVEFLTRGVAVEIYFDFDRRPGPGQDLNRADLGDQREPVRVLHWDGLLDTIVRLGGNGCHGEQGERGEFE